MGLEDDLYSELLDLRDYIRESRAYSNGRSPPVCSDEALKEMAQRVPTRLDDLTAIPGVGARFVELYGDEFLAVTRKYAITAAKGSTMDPQMTQVLREFQKKLTNISKGNRLLYQPRIQRKNAFDLMTIPKIDIFGLMFGDKHSLRICDTADGPESLKMYRHLNEIIREVNRDLREKGQYDLYIAYPFVEGRLADEDAFDIRAPLALFPVVLEKDSRSITLKMDDTRDVVYNNSFILAFSKFSGRRRHLVSNVVEEYYKDSFVSMMADFYRDQGIVLDITHERPSEFMEYKADGFPKYQAGYLKVTYNLVLGKYPTYSSYIQKDFDDILVKGEINMILADLIRNLDLEDFYDEGLDPLESSAHGIPEATERAMTYINSLNSAQERVLTSVNESNRLVVHGPPGTGKSQVITGLITSAVNEGKTVLMVSEKKTALDVVHSRLGGLSKYCLLIDDVANKNQFYMQLKDMLDVSLIKRAGDVSNMSSSIDRSIDTLKGIANKVYRPGPFGIAPYKLYEMERWLDPNDRVQFEEYRSIKGAISSKVVTLRYDDLRDLYDQFSDPILMSNVSEYCECVSRIEWMSLMRPNLSEFEIGEMRADILNIEEQVIELNSKGILSRMFSKGKVAREATNLLNKYFNKYGAHTIQTILDDPRGVFDALEDYQIFSSKYATYDRLEEVERIYARNIIELSRVTGKTTKEANDDLYRFVLNDNLQRFDSENRAVLQEIQDFEGIVADIDHKIAEKREASKVRVEEILQNHLKYITESKRCGEIAKIIDNRRKWSLNKFIGKYSYELFKGVKIWLLTPEVVSEILPLEIGLFDMLIFDEASQMYVEKGIPSIYRAKKVVVAGDHKQLRPSSLGSGRMEYGTEDDSSTEDDEMALIVEEESLLDLARTRYDSILLNFHYRSKYEELIAFSNYAFYDGRLYVSPNVVTPERPPIEVHRMDGLWESKSNIEEAKKVMELLKAFFKDRREDETVGIITFNISQRDLIQDLLEEEASKGTALGKEIAKELRRVDNNEDVGLFVKNIESVQGDERDVIIFSVGYAKNKDGRLMQRFGWLNNAHGENRLNVAITRAKKKVHIVTSFDPEDLQTESSKNDGPRILKRYLQYANAVSRRDKEAAMDVLTSFTKRKREERKVIEGESPMVERVYLALVRKGYSVDRDIGIGGYKIDLAVRHENRYVLGIECDRSLYEEFDSTRERDYHRSKYLESRGWRIHRVWSPNMWRNPQKEMNGIVDAIERSIASNEA